MKALTIYSQMNYNSINHRLRTGRDGSDIEEILKDLTACPSMKGKVYRGVSLMRVKHLQIGDTYMDKAFLSTSRNKEQAISFAEGRTKPALLELTSKTGRDIAFVSTYPKEEEVLFPPGTLFRVLDIDIGGSIPIYTLEEI